MPLLKALDVKQEYKIRNCFPEGEIRSDGSVLVVLYDPREQKDERM